MPGTLRLHPKKKKNLIKQKHSIYAHITMIYAAFMNFVWFVWIVFCS